MVPRKSFPDYMVQDDGEMCGVHHCKFELDSNLMTGQLKPWRH